LALFGRRLSARVDSLGMPASENLHMNDRSHRGKPEPFRRPDRCEVDRGTRFEACYLAPDCSGNAPAGEVKWQLASEDVN
jgi:hypothetical protein